jgi:hypothetical protein
LVDALTRIVQIKKPLSEKDKDELLKQITDANSLIIKQSEELKAHKDAVKEIIEEQEEIIQKCCVKAKIGFALEKIECAIKYDGNVAKHYDKKTGEIIDESTIVQDQQISMIDEDDIEDESNNDD